MKVPWPSAPGWPHETSLALDVEAWTQARRDEAARLSGQRTPSEKTWALVLGKLETRKAA